MGFSLGKTLGNVISGAVSGGAVGGIPGAIVGGALGGASGYLDAYQDKSALKYQNAQNVALWDMQNAYNTPKAQMARFDEAGLNKNLIYSQSNEAGSITGGTLQNNNSQIGGQIRSAQQQRLNTLSAYSSLASAQAQREYTQAQTANIGIQQQLERARLGLEARRVELAERFTPYQIMGTLINAQNQTRRIDSDINNSNQGWLGRIFGNETAKNIKDRLWNIYHSDYEPGGRFYVQ